MSTTVEEARAEATALVEADPDAIALRSCWNCNGAHDRLQDAGYVICCLICGRYFYKGIDITTDAEPAGREERDGEAG